MPIKQKNEDGEEYEVYTKEDMDAEIARVSAEKDEHNKKKLEEFMQGKKGLENKEAEYQRQVEEANKKAQEAVEMVNKEALLRKEAIKKYYVSQYAGEDEVLQKKLTDEMQLLNMPSETEDDMKAIVAKAAKLSGLDQTSGAHTTSYGGMGIFNPMNETKKQEDLEAFKNNMGFGWMKNL